MSKGYNLHSTGKDFYLNASKDFSKLTDTHDSRAVLRKDHLTILPNFDIVRINFSKVDTFPIVKTSPCFYQDVLLQPTKFVKIYGVIDTLHTGISIIKYNQLYISKNSW